MKHQITTLASTTATDDELIAAPGAEKSIHIYGIFVSSDVQQQIDFETDNTTNVLLHRQFVAANGGSIAAFSPAGGFGARGDEKKSVLWVVPINEALTFTTSVSGNVVVEVWYSIESR